MHVFIVNIILILWALHKFGKNISTGVLRIHWLTKPGVELKDYILSSVLAGFDSLSWRRDFVNQSRLWRSQIWDFRRFLFSSSQTLFSFFWVMLCFALFLEVGSFTVLGFAFFVLAASYIPKLRLIPSLRALRSLVYFALSLFFLELAFKNSGLMMQYLMDTELVFFLTIDSIANLLPILVGAVVLGFFIPVQGWSLVTSFLFFVNSQLSFLGMVFLVIGELLGTAIWLMVRVRSWDNYYQKKLGHLLKWVVGYLLVFAVGAFVWKRLFTFGRTFNELELLKWIFLGTILLLLAGLYVTVMAWGHFTVVKQDKDVVVSDAGLIGELERNSDDPVSLFITAQLRARLEKLQVYRNDLRTDPESKKKIPPFVLNQFEAEIKIIERLKS